MEKDQWMAAIAVYADRRPTRDNAEFVRRLGEMEATPLRMVADACEVIGDVRTYSLAPRSEGAGGPWTACQAACSWSATRWPASTRYTGRG
ncbi:hypothetical protein [Streptomyces sp. A1136]|uniref:hypothetical protein n=1 Tax=Streptomyces sp. A1136 TaxID=2563102 RepID=UPI00109E65BA|nr:hypothetical protein [Streptomyces sp. A1136]THA49836.1 hypothetical protein E6R62_27220 [Streptomyces sp. A1136]